MKNVSRTSGTDSPLFQLLGEFRPGTLAREKTTSSATSRVRRGSSSSSPMRYEARRSRGGYVRRELGTLDEVEAGVASICS